MYFEKRRENKRRLTKKEVSDLLRINSLFEKEISDLFRLHVLFKHEVYTLPDNKMLFVYREPSGTNGKGDLFDKEVFESIIIDQKQKRRNISLGITSTHKWWIYFSRHGEGLINKIDELIDELKNRLSLSSEELDFSLPSLDLVSNKIKEFGIDKAETELVDSIVAYAGEVLRRKLKGAWKIRGEQEDSRTPAVYVETSWFFKHNWYSPVEKVFVAFTEPSGLDFKGEVKKEISRFNLNKGKSLSPNSAQE